MAAETILNLFDSYWFETTILTKKSTSPSQTMADSISHNHMETFAQEKTKLWKRISTLQVRSFSDQNMGSAISFSSDSPSPKMKTVLSGKKVRDFPIENNIPGNMHEEKEILTKKKVSNQNHRRRHRKIKTSKSLSELEFKELKGFMDLGFVFSEEDKDSSKLVSLIPGLQRLGNRGGDGEEKERIDENMISRPYLSEAWGVLDRRKVGDPLLNWKVPALGNEIDMKDNLRFWAHTVASIVR